MNACLRQSGVFVIKHDIMSIQILRQYDHVQVFLLPCPASSSAGIKSSAICHFVLLVVCLMFARLSTDALSAALYHHHQFLSDLDDFC